MPRHPPLPRAPGCVGEDLCILPSRVGRPGLETERDGRDRGEKRLANVTHIHGGSAMRTRPLYRRAPAGESAVSIRGVHVRRSAATVLEDVSMDVTRGSVLGLLGPSGCGKTTLVRSILGVQRGVRGRLTVLGHPAGSRQLRSRVAAVPQAASVYDELTVQRNARYFARIVGADDAAVDDALASVDLDGVRHRPVGRLSGGQRNRVSLAIALLGRPELLLLDEPTVGLDPILRIDLWRLFRRLADAGTTIVVTSHSLDEAARCDELVLMRAGRVVVHTTPRELLLRTGARTAEDAFVTLVQDPMPPTSFQAPAAERREPEMAGGR